MERLRERMAVDLRVRGRSPVTQRMYLGCVERFVVDHHRRSPKAPGEAEIRACLDHLVVERQLSRSTQRVHVAAIRFLYEVTLDRPFTVRRLPFPHRDGERLPEILSLAEVERLLCAPSRPNHRAILMTLYGAGLWVSEVCELVPKDIDSERRVRRVFGRARGMKALLDTQVWIWMRNNPTKLSARARRLLVDSRTELLLSAAVPWEIAIKVSIGKLRLPCSVEEFVASRTEATRVVPLPITQFHAVASARLPPHHRDPFDRVLVAQARIERVPFLATDETLARSDVEIVRAN